MYRILALFVFAAVVMTAALEASGQNSVACLWSGSFAKCLPASGILLDNQRIVRFKELASNGANYVQLGVPASLTGDRTITFPDAAGAIVLDTATQTLTNKTLTSPAISTPTGIVKGDVGLGNVDNTSDATKDAASATLTNKTLTSPVINSPTGLVKADVGLGNVDNTSDATKDAATATLTNKTINGASNTLTVRAASDITGQLPLTNGGTAKSLTAAAGGVVWSDADSLEITAAGTAGTSWLVSGGTATPVWNSLVSGATAGAQTWNFQHSRDDASSPDLRLGLQSSRGTVASPAILSTSDTTGAIVFRGYDGAAFLPSASIMAIVGAAPGTNDMAGELIFSTTADGAAAVTERMRIDNDGSVTIADTGANGGNVPHQCQIRTTACAGTTTTCDQACSAGEIVTGGGCQSTGGTPSLTRNYPVSATTWRCFGSGSVASDLDVYAICCDY